MRRGSGGPAGQLGEHLGGRSASPQRLPCRRRHQVRHFLAPRPAPSLICLPSPPPQICWRSCATSCALASTLHRHKHTNAPLPADPAVGPLCRTYSRPYSRLCSPVARRESARCGGSAGAEAAFARKPAMLTVEASAQAGMSAHRPQEGRRRTVGEAAGPPRLRRGAVRCRHGVCGQPLSGGGC